MEMNGNDLYSTYNRAFAICIVDYFCAILMLYLFGM